MTRKLLISIIALGVAIMADAQSTFKSNLSAKAAKNATIYGTVECNGKPLQGVAVSDGINVVTTDKKGCYNIASAKRLGYVFVSIPSGYMVETRDAIPQMWANLEKESNVAERHDFSLNKAENNRHTLIAVTDIHIANKFDDVYQFETVFMPRLREEIHKYESQGIPVYSICMGDTSFDRFWYEYYFSIEDFIPLLRKVNYPIPMFHTTGNHDNDAATPQGDDMDFRSTEKFRKAYGPTFYSFNIGKVHYIMFDDVYYIHKPVKKPDHKGLTGDHSYEIRMNEDEKIWLANDLKLVDKSTPIIVGMHADAIRYKGVSREIQARFYTKDKSRSREEVTNEYTEYFKDFKQVHFISGHEHWNSICYGKDDTSKLPYIGNIIEHNISSVSGAWWVTRAQGGPSLDPAGGDAGFAVFPVDGDKIEWYFVSNDQGAEKQFRVFDMNSVREIYRTRGDFKPFVTNYPSRANYAEIEDNMILVNVWAWDPHWEMHIYEDGKEIKWERKMTENPQYTWTYFIPHVSWAEKWLKKYAKQGRYPNYFWAKASSATSTIEVTVKDTFGHEYKETVKRPKPFTRDMN